nr:HAD-IB family phosphatase [uncultured Porphyromonas sp.]
MSHSHQITFLRSLSAQELELLEELCRPLGQVVLQPLHAAPELHELRLSAVAAEGTQELAERRRLLELLLPWARGRSLPFYYPSSEAARPIRRVAFDLDGTLIRDELMVLLAGQVGRGEEMQQLTEAAMCGARPFRESFVARSQLLLGLSEAELLRPLAQLSFAPDAAELIAALQRRGLELCLITGAYEPLAAALGARLGIPLGCASAVALEGGHLAGLVEEAIVDAEAKARYLHEWAGRELAATLALGDGANDIHMLSTAGHALHYSCIAPSAPSLIHLLELLQRLTHIL